MNIGRFVEGDMGPLRSRLRRDRLAAIGFPEAIPPPHVEDARGSARLAAAAPDNANVLAYC